MEQIALEKLGIEVIDGDRGKNYPHQDELMAEGDCLFLSAKNVTTSGFDFTDNQFISAEKDSILRNGKLNRGDIVITTRGTVGNVGLYNESVPYDDVRINSGMLIVRCVENISREYLYNVLRSKWFYQKIKAMQTGSAQPQLPKSHFLKMEIPVPTKEIQDKIADIIMQFERKIQCNDAINRNLLDQARLLYKSWFMDFDNNSGVMPDDWHIGTVSEIIELHDSKRKPLSGNERDKLEKIYPYYGATSIMDYVDDYLFDGIYLLLGEDGSVIDAEGYPILQYVFGKFWCNNHAHIITGKNGFSVEALYLLFSLTYVNDIVTGAVQLKISQQNLNKVEAVIPSLVALKEFDEIIQPMFGQIRKLRLENENLTKIRDSLLPKLMSGELDVSDLDI